MTPKPLTTEEWVQRLNVLAAAINEACYGVHPSVWAELTRDLRRQFRELAHHPTQDDDQLVLEGF